MVCAGAMLLGLPWGCGKNRGSDTQYIARVGNARLTNEALLQSGAAQAEHLSLQYVTNWVTNELLYQEALRKGFTETDEVLRQAAEAKRQLAINAYLQKEIYASDAPDISDDSLSTEFKEHRNEYRLREDVVNLSFAVFVDREPANAFRLKLLHGTSWSDALQGVPPDSNSKQQILRVATREYFTQPMLYPEELWKIAQTLNKEEVSYVVKTSAGYCIAVVHATMKQGDAPDFEYAKEEIKERLTIARRKAEYDELLGTLRKKYDVDVRLDSIETPERTLNE